MPPRLSVNVDHVATLRQARRAAYPSPLEAAVVAEAAGASGITVHLRGDRRHVQEADVVELRRAVRGKLNLEMAATEAMVELAIRLRPDQATLVPERPEEVTTEGGLDIEALADPVARAAERLRAEGLAVSLFLDPDVTRLERLLELGPLPVDGFEINTDRFTRAEGSAAERELEKIRESAAFGERNGLAIYAGHGLTSANVGPIAAIPEIRELNIGHSIVSRAVIVGMDVAVREMLRAMGAATDG